MKGRKGKQTKRRWVALSPKVGEEFAPDFDSRFGGDRSHCQPHLLRRCGCGGALAAWVNTKLCQESNYPSHQSLELAATADSAFNRRWVSCRRMPDKAATTPTATSTASFLTNF